MHAMWSLRTSSVVCSGLLSNVVPEWSLSMCVCQYGVTINVVSSAPTEKVKIPGSTPVHQNHRKHTSVKRPEEQHGSGRNYDNKKGTSGLVLECPGVAGSFGTLADVAGAVLGAPEAIFGI